MTHMLARELLFELLYTEADIGLCIDTGNYHDNILNLGDK